MPVKETRKGQFSRRRKARRALGCKERDWIVRHQPSQSVLYTVLRSFILLILSLIDLGSNSHPNTQFLCGYGELMNFPEFKLGNKNNLHLQSFCEVYISNGWSINHIAGPLLHTQSIFAIIITSIFVQAVLHLLAYSPYLFKSFLCFKFGSRFTKSLKSSQTILTLHWLLLFWISVFLYSCIHSSIIYLLSTYNVVTTKKYNNKVMPCPTHGWQIPHNLIFHLKMSIHFTSQVTYCFDILNFIFCSQKFVERTNVSSLISLS